MATKILISFYCPDFSSTGIVKQVLIKFTIAANLVNIAKLTDMIPKLRKELPPTTSRFARRLFWVELR